MILNMNATMFVKEDKVMRHNDFSDRRLKILIVLVGLLIGWLCIKGASGPYDGTEIIPDRSGRTEP